jgi:hypothetical protein
LTGPEYSIGPYSCQSFTVCCPNPRFISAIGIDEIEKFLI